MKFWPENRQRNHYSLALERLGVEILDETNPCDFPSWITENGPDLDHVMIMRPTIARAFLPDVVLNTDARRSYYGHDIHFLRLEREAEVTKDQKTREDALTMRRLETWLWPQFHAVLYLSRYEADLVRELAPNAQPHAIVPFCFTPDLSARPVTSGKNHPVCRWIRSPAQCRCRSLACARNHAAGASARAGCTPDPRRIETST